MDSNKLVISYSGSLAYYDPEMRFTNKVFSFRNFGVNNPSTHSGYFLFAGLKKFAELYPDQKDNITLHTWGLIDERYKALAQQMGIGDMVQIERYVTQVETVKRMQNTDVFFLPLEKGVNGHEPYALPEKLFEYLQAGKPVLALCTESECARILRASGLGIVVDPEDPTAIAEGIKVLYNQKKGLVPRLQPNTEYIRQHFSAPVLAAKLANAIRGLV